MFPSFIGILDIQSWWEVPSIAHFCSLFRQVFNLLDFDIEDLELSLLEDSEQDEPDQLLPLLIARLLNGCLHTCDVSTHNYQMYLRRLFRAKCEQQNIHNPFNSDIDFKFLPLRSKVEALHALCDFRLESDDVVDLLKNLDPESLRVEPLGYDKNGSAYWYFYGTRLYREDLPKSRDFTNNKEKSKPTSKSIWQVICFTQQDWINLVQRFERSKHFSDILLSKILIENFLPEIPKLFKQKENQQRKRLLNLQPRRISIRVNHKLEDSNQASNCNHLDTCTSYVCGIERNNYINSYPDYCHYSTMAPTTGHKTKSTKVTGRQTNNSLASATGQILIQNKTNRLPSVQAPDTEIFCQTDEDLQTGMYKILEYLKNHDDAWPFIDPVEEEYAPNYYSIIRRPMDLQRMEDKLDSGEYARFSEFRSDFQLLVNNCRLYNGQDNEYTEMVDNLQQAFVKATNRFLEQTSSDEELDFPIKPLPNLTRGRPKLKEKAPSNDKKNVQNNTKLKHSIRALPEPVHKRQRSPEESPSRKKKKINSPISDIKNPVKTNKKTKKKLCKKDTKKMRNSHEAKESDSSPSKNEENDSLKCKSAQQDKSILTEKKSYKNGSATKIESADKKKVGRPSKKKKRNKYKKKHNKRSTKMNQKVKGSEKKSVSKEMHDSEDDISSRSRSPTPLYSYSDNSGSEMFGFGNETPNKVKIKSQEKLPAEEEDKFDKIKNRHKDKTRTLKSKSKDVSSVKHSTNHENDTKRQLYVGERNLKLSDTIEKLRAKNEKSKERAVLFDEIFGKTQPEKKVPERKLTKDEYEFTDESETKRNKSSDKKADKKSNKKHISNDISMDALEAETEQTLKDMNKWFTESQVGSTSHHLPKADKKKSVVENVLVSSKKSEKDVKNVDKSNLKKDSKDITKRKFLRDSMKQLFNKKREVQRTIDRLQPGKSKGNLINSTNTQPITKAPAEESIIPLLKSKEVGAQPPSSPVSETCPKLSLGSVLPTGGFGLVQQHNFNDDLQKEKACVSSTSEATVISSGKEKDLTQVNEISSLKSSEEDEEILEKPFKVCQEKATPNLSAWFKAFGAPKNPKKKSEEVEDAQQTVIPNVTQSNYKSDQPEKVVTHDKIIELESEGPDNSINIESPESNPTPRTRRTSTGSTVSDRSNFSQDMDSPKIGMDERINSSYPLPYPSPINKNIVTQSKISPKSEDIQKSINVGFYQDTTTKSSPEKSCSPQEHSPTIQTTPSSATTCHIYPSQNSPNPLQSYPYSNVMSYDHIQSRSGVNNSIPYYETSKSYDYKAPLLQDNVDYVSLSPNNSTKTFSQPNSPYQQSNQAPYVGPNGRHLTGPNQVALGPNSPFSCSNQSSPYSNSDLSSPYGTPQPNSPYSHQAAQLSPNHAVSVAYPKKRAHIDEKNNSGTQLPPLLNVAHSNVSTNTEKKQMHSLLQPNEMNIKKPQIAINDSAPMAELINMGYSKPEDKLEQIPTSEKMPQNIKLHVNTASSLSTGSYSSTNLSGHEIKNNSDENAIKKDLDKLPDKLIDMYNPASAGFGHSAIPSNFSTASNPQILSQKCTEMLNMNYENRNTDVNRKIATKTDDNIIHYKHSQLSKNIASPNTSMYSDIYSKNLNRVSDIMEMTDSNSKKLTSPLNATGTKITMPSNHHHNEFMNYSSRNLNIPGINLNINQNNSNIHIPNSFSNIEARVPPNAHIGLTLNQPTSLHPRNYDIHNPSNANLDLNNPNYKFNTSSSSAIDQSIRKFSNISQIVDHHVANEYRTPPPVSNYYDAKNLQLQPQNAHSVSIASMPIFSQSQTISMAYNRQASVSTSNINIQSHIQSSITVPEVTKLTQPEQKKSKSRKKKTVADHDMIAQHQGFQSYSGVKPTPNESATSTSIKGKNIPGSAFNFGSTASTLNIPSALYNNSESYLDDYRSNTNPYYLSHRPTTQEQDKNRSNQAVSQFQYLSAPAPRSTDYPFIGSTSGGLDSTSPLYQQYLQRHQEDLLRQQTNAQMLLNQGLLSNHAAYASPRYHPSLGIRQTYDPMNPRPPWL